MNFLKEKLNDGWIRLLIYASFLTGFYFFSLRGIPDLERKVETHGNKIAAIEARSEQMDKRLESIDTKTGDIYRLILSMNK